MQFGVDEAGKGPVLGPMVAACVVGDPDRLPDGVDDSKRLSPARREELDAAVRGDASFAVGVARVGTDRIDDPATDMNALTVAAHVEAMDDVLADGASGVCDAGDVDADRFAGRVAAGVTADVTVHAEHRADESHPLVAAASVVAKVERDAAVDALRERYAGYGDVGSGYPSDPTTRAFLAAYVEAHGDLPDCARRSWSTCDDVLAAAEQSSLDAF